MSAMLGLAVLALHGAAVAGLAGRRFWIHKVDRDSLQGSDLHMLKWCREQDTRAYAFFHMEFARGDFEGLKAEIVRNIEAALQDPDSPYRMGCDVQAGRYIRRPDVALTNLVELVDDDDAFYRVDDDAKRELVIRFHRGRQLFGCLFDHTVWDGIAMFNEILNPALQAKPFDSRWLVPPSYIPVASEAMQLAVAYRMGQRLLTHRPLPTLPDEEQCVFSMEESVAAVKATKNRLGVGFTPAMLGHYAARMFSWVPESRKALRFGVVVGMTGDRFRNNYSLVTVSLKRADRDSLVRQAARQLKRGELEVQPLYELINLVELQSRFKTGVLDCLFSPAFFAHHEGPSASVREVSLLVMPTVSPCYCFAVSVRDRICLTVTRNSPLLDYDRMAAEAATVWTNGGDGRALRRDLPQAEAALG
jgi:hypothetical protein